MKDISFMNVAKRKILYIVSEDASGMRPYAATILKTVMNENSWAVIVVRDDKSKDSYKLLPQQNIIYLDYPQRKLGKLIWHFYPKKLINAIERLIENNRIELVHTLTLEISLAYVVRRLFKGVTVLHTVHDAIDHEVKHRSVIDWVKHKMLVSNPNKKIIGWAKNIVTNSKPQVEYLQKKYPKKRVFYVPFPTLVNDAIKIGGQDVAELKNVRDYILFFGNVNLYKGVHLLYRLYCKYKNELGGRKLVIAGSGDDYFGMNYNDSDIIRINRYINDSEVKALFDNAAVVVYPYISATQSGVLSIASYFAKKIVVSNIPFFSSISGNYTGISLVDVTKEDEFLFAVKDMLIRDEQSCDFYAAVYESNSLRNVVEQVYDITFKNSML